MKGNKKKPQRSVRDKTQNKIKKANVVEKEEESIGDEAVDDVTSVTKGSSQSSRALRGVCIMENLEQLRRKGEKKDIELDLRGQPIGTNGTQLQSYIGVVARKKIKITYKGWKEVPESIKKSIWASVNDVFNIDPNWRRACLASADQKWRSHKARLMKLYVLDRIHDPDLMNTPPAKYPHIKQNVWSQFVISRMSNDFQEKSRKQREARARHKYPHRISHKGYARYANENPSLLSGDLEVDRTILWMEVRKTKKGKHEGEDLNEKVSKMVEYIDMKKAGTEFYGVKDGILSKALEKDEVAGRVRGVGGHVTPSTYFSLPTRNVSNREILERLDILERKVLATSDTYSSKNENELFESPVEKYSYSFHCNQVGEDEDLDEDQVKDDDIDVEDMVLNEKSDEILNASDVNLQGKPVALCLKSTNIVAYGTIIKAYGPTEVIHGKKLPLHCMRVSIDTIVVPKAKLPILANEFKCVGDALGSHVAWPVDLMTLYTVDNIKKQGKEKTKCNMVTLPKSSVPSDLYMLYCYSKAGGDEVIPLDEDVFGRHISLPLHFEGIDIFCRLQPISYTCIVIYMLHLFNILKRNNDDRFRFVDPFGIGHVPPKPGKVLKANNIINRAHVLSKRLVGASLDQLCIVPCNIGEHWILTIIDPHKEEVCLLDPLSSHNTDEKWEAIVDMALKLFFSKTKTTEPKKKPTWKVIKAPRQPDSMQCGFYVLRYMRQITQFDGSLGVASMQSLFMEKTYTTIQIDDVRSEWTTCVQEYVFG